jgi:hypothetical protein
MALMAGLDLFPADRGPVNSNPPERAKPRFNAMCTARGRTAEQVRSSPYTLMRNTEAKELIDWEIILGFFERWVFLLVFNACALLRLCDQCVKARIATQRRQIRILNHICNDPGRQAMIYGFVQ